MKKFIIVISIVLSIGILYPQNSNGFRCKGSLIDVGDYKYVVLKKCGNPKHKECVRIGAEKQPKVDHWVYEQYGCIYCLIFMDNRLFKIEQEYTR